MIAAVNGPAAGAGLSLACGCDVRVAAESASFVPAFVGVGLVPDSGGSLFVSRLLGQPRAFEWLTSNRRLTAAEAKDWGLVSEVVPDADFGARVAEIAETWAEMPTLAVGMTKRLVERAGTATIEEQLEAEEQHLRTRRRRLARRAGMTNKALAAQLRVSFAKVAEYQRRGVVHFHAIIRLDGPTRPGSAPPTWATIDLLTAAIAQAADATHLETPDAPGLPARTLCWGREHDTRPITTTGELTDIRVAAYVAKYATKAAECTGTLDRRITPADQLAELPVSEHARRLIAACLRLGKLPELADLRLAAWAHMLGFRGHFSTKSRRYSTTFGALRAERAQHQRDHATTGSLWPEPEGDTTLVLAHWRFAGQGQPPITPPSAGRPPIRHPTAGPAGGRPAMTRLLLTVPEAAEALAISRSKLYELLASGAVASIRIDGSRRIPLAALEEYISRLLAERTAA